MRIFRSGINRMISVPLVLSALLSQANGFVSGPSESQPTVLEMTSPRRWDIDPSLSRREAWDSVAAASFTAAASGILIPSPVKAEDKIRPIAKVPTVRLGGGKSSLEVSRTIQGHWQLAGGHGRYRERDAVENMQAHFDSGITTLDTADIYGPSELIVGKFVLTQPKAIPFTKFCCFRYLEVGLDSFSGVVQ
jgi:hypothetical protein